MRQDRLHFVTIDTEDINPPATRRPKIIGQFALEFAVARLTSVDIDNLRPYSDRLQSSIVAAHVLAFSDGRERVPDERNRHLNLLDGVHRWPPDDIRWLSWASRVASRYAWPQVRSGSR